MKGTAESVCHFCPHKKQKPLKGEDERREMAYQKRRELDKQTMTAHEVTGRRFLKFFFLSIFFVLGHA